MMCLGRKPSGLLCIAWCCHILATCCGEERAEALLDSSSLIPSLSCDHWEMIKRMRSRFQLAKMSFLCRVPGLRHPDGGWSSCSFMLKGASGGGSDLITSLVFWEHPNDPRNNIQRFDMEEDLHSCSLIEATVKGFKGLDKDAF